MKPSRLEVLVASLACFALAMMLFGWMIVPTLKAAK